MQGRAGDGVLAGRVREGQVKSRLIEAHPVEASGDGAQALLASVAETADLDLAPMSDDLWLLSSSDESFFVDTLNPRFWLLHTTARAKTIRSLWRQHFVSSPRLDSAWLPASQLRELEGNRRWIKSSFSSDQLQPRASTGEVVPRRWRVQVEGDTPDELLELVSRHAKYRASASLTAVATILRDEQLGNAEVAADYQGGFVSSGSSFEVVVGLLWRSLDRYESYVRDLESRFQLRTQAAPTDASDEVALSFEGEVAHIEFPHEVEDIDAFVANLFNCREPFRLWAVPREVGSGQWEANAVDLHVGHTLRLEMAPRWMRILLGEHTCGNTLARLLANLQHRFDAQTRLASPVAAS